MDTIKNTTITMKYRIRYRLISLCLIVGMAFLFSCGESFLYKSPTGAIFEESMATKTGLDGLLIGAYSIVTGVNNGNFTIDQYSASSRNWVLSMGSDDVGHGTIETDATDMEAIERYQVQTINSCILANWKVPYDGVSRANDVLRVLATAREKKAILETDAVKIEAQAKFLRAWWHFRMIQTFWQIPYITEVDNPKEVKNDHKPWAEIEKDFLFATSNLPESWPGEPGRATKWAASAYLAYVKLHQKKYSEAKPLLDAIINSGKYVLVDNIRDNFDATNENNKESIFEIQHSANDGSGATSLMANADCWVVGPPANYTGLNTCCGYYSPKQDLVNAFKVDANGLPLLGINGPKFNDTNLKNDMTLSSSTTFVPTTDPVDPRLDQTVGRRGVMYLDWGIMTGNDWIRYQPHAGPYLQKKIIYSRKEMAAGHMQSTLSRAHDINDRRVRFSHVLLWRAECAVEENDLETARNLVNRIRIRAAKPGNITMGFCKDNAFNATNQLNLNVDFTLPAANYSVKQYASFPSQVYAREAVRMEERLEFALEGYRFFDLVRWGIDYDVLTKFIENDSKIRYTLQGTTYVKNKNSYFPIPQSELDIQPSLSQDPLWK